MRGKTVITSIDAKLKFAFRQTGEEKFRIERLGGPLAPVWGVSFNPVREDDLEVIAAVDWTQMLSFYDISGKQVTFDVILHPLFTNV